MLSDERIREIDAMSPQEDAALNAIQELLREREELITTIRLLDLQRYSVHLVNHPHPENQYWSLHLYAIDGPGRDKIWTGPLYEVIDAAWDYTRKPRWYDETN